MTFAETCQTTASKPLSRHSKVSSAHASDYMEDDVGSSAPPVCEPADTVVLMYHLFRRNDKADQSRTSLRTTQLPYCAHRYNSSRMNQLRAWTNFKAAVALARPCMQRVIVTLAGSMRVTITATIEGALH